jgi:hypothetical protein
MRTSASGGKSGGTRSAAAAARREQHEQQGTSIAGELDSEFGGSLADKFTEYINTPSDKLAEEIRDELARQARDEPDAHTRTWTSTLGTYCLITIIILIVVLSFFAFKAWRLSIPGLNSGPPAAVAIVHPYISDDSHGSTPADNGSPAPSSTSIEKNSYKAPLPRNGPV